ncbi:type IV secretion system protein [Succinimonas amylolytica]|uniref:type IV secretion system protein n=1 Tax=Succinimonas amylolytica TaxID=83769 RepID=UPI0003743526|nr:type IV secretion system protein [Succinimonas amylolytica]
MKVIKSNTSGIIITLLVVLLCNQQVFANDDLSNIDLNQFGNILDIIEAKISKVGNKVSENAANLLLMLAFFNLFILGVKQLFKGANFQELILEVVKFILVIGFFMFVIEQGPTTFISATEQFIGMTTTTATAGTTSVYGFVQLLFDKTSMFMFTALLHVENATSWGVPQPSVLLAALVIIITGLIVLAIAINMIITMIQSWFVLTAGMFAVGFGGLSFTNQYAMNYLKSFIVFGVQLMSLAFIGTVVIEICDQISNYMQYNPVTKTAKMLNLAELCSIMSIMLILFFCSFAVPHAITGLIEGGSQASKTISSWVMTTMIAKAVTSSVGKGVISGITGGTGALAIGAAKLASNYIKGQQTDIELGGMKGGIQSSDKNKKASDNNPIRERSKA